MCALCDTPTPTHTHTHTHTHTELNYRTNNNKNGEGGTAGLAGGGGGGSGETGHHLGKREEHDNISPSRAVPQFKRKEDSANPLTQCLCKQQRGRVITCGKHIALTGSSDQHFVY